MTLPYPPEVETGQLKTRRRRTRSPFDVEAHVREAIQVAGSELRVFERRRRLASPEAAREASESWRRDLVAHFQARRPNADAATWRSFATQARALAEGCDEIDAALLRALLMTIEGL